LPTQKTLRSGKFRLSVEAAGRGSITIQDKLKRWIDLDDIENETSRAGEYFGLASAARAIFAANDIVLSCKAVSIR
jgi:hypothetical protein